jgi:hypothetical protein
MALFTDNEETMADQGPLLTWLQRLSHTAVGQRLNSRTADRPLTLTHIGSAEELAAEIAAAKRRLAPKPPIASFDSAPTLLPKAVTPAPSLDTSSEAPTRFKTPAASAPQAQAATPPAIPIIDAPSTPAPGVSEPKRLSFIEAEERAIESRIAELRAAEERAAQRRLEIERRLAALTPEVTPEERPAPAPQTAPSEAVAPSSPITIRIGRLDAVHETNAGK